MPRDSAAPISHATFSCDSQLVYASFLDATVCVFSAANLRLRCRINPSVYLPANVRYFCLSTGQLFFFFCIFLMSNMFEPDFQGIENILFEFWFCPKLRQFMGLMDRQATQFQFS